MASLLDKAYERKRNQTQSAVSDLSLLERARSRKAGSTQSDVEDRIQTFLKNHDTFIGNYTRRARTANPGSDLDSWQDAVESQRNAFRKEGQQLLSLLEQNSAWYDPDWVASSKQALNDALGHQAGALQYIGGLQKEANRQRAWRAAPEAVEKTLEQLPKAADAVKNAVYTSVTGDRLPSMDDYMRMYGYHNTYGGKSYQELMDAANAMEDGEEKDWILSYAPSVMTSEDYQSRIDRNEELIPILERYQQLTQVRQNDAVRKAYGISGSVDEEEFLAEAERMAKTAGYTSAEEAAADLENLRKENWEYEGKLKFGSIRNNEDYDQRSAAPSASREELEAVAKMRNAIIQGDPEKTQAMQRQAEAAARHLGYASAEQVEMALRAMDQGLPASGNEKYSYINDIGGYRDVSKAMFGDTGPGNKERSGPGTGPYAVYDAMTPEEIADYNYIYNTMGEKDAEEYLERLEYTLNQRRMDEALGEAERMAIFNPGMAFVKSVAGNMVGGAGAVDVAIQNARRTLTGEYRPVDYNRSVMMPTMESAMIRGSQTRQINNQFGTIQLDPEEHPYLSRFLNGKGWGDAYQLGASLIDSAAVAALSPVVGSWGTALLGSNAAAQSMVETAQRGGTDQQALAMGLLAGGAEMLFEKYELDQLLGQSDKWLRSVVNQALSEGVGEGATSVANTLTDILIMADKSQLAELTAEYEASGMSHSDARKEAFLDIAAQIGTDALGGFLTGGIMGGSAAILNKIGGNNHTSAQEAPEETVPPYMEPTTVQAQASEAQEAEPAPAIPQKQLSEEELQAIPKRMDAAANASDPFAAYGEKAEGAEQIPQEQVTEKETKKEPSREKIKAPKEGFQVSGSGKTVVSGEDGEINIKRIAEPVNGEMVLELEDGRKVRASEVEFADDGLATVYEMAASLNTDAETANLVIDTWLKEPGGVSAEDFALGAAEVFWNGAHNLDVADNRYGARLTKLQRSNTYFLGKRYGQLDVASAQTAAMRRRMAQRFSEKEKGGWLKYDGDWDSLTETERTNLNAIETVAKAFGMRFQVYESQVDEQGRHIGDNGWYDPKDGTIHIDLYAGADGRGTMLFTAAHEMTHFIKDWSAEKFKVLADFLMEQYRSKGQSVNDLIDAQILKAEGNNRSIDRDTAFEEVIADSMESMLADGSILEKLEALKVKDRTLWEKIRDHIRELAAKIREIYQNLKPDSREGQYVAQWDKEFTRLQEMFLEGAVEAGKNYQRSVLRPDKEGTVVNENGEPVADSVDEIQNTIPRTEAEIAEAEVEQADRDLEAGEISEENVRHSMRENRKKRITMSMSDSERTEILKDKVITVEVYEGQADKSIKTEKNDLKSNRDNLIKSALVKIGEEFGVYTDYRIADVEIDLRFSRSNLKESVSKKIDPIQIAKLIPVLKTAVENAIGIECHANRYFYDNDTVMFENLIGGYVEGKDFVPVRFGLKHSVTGKVTLYLVVDQEKIAIEKIKAEVSKETAAQKDRPNTSRSAFKISIASVVPFVNGKDLLRYLPDDMLNAKQKETKYEAIADTIAYTNDKNDSRYTDYIRSGNIATAKQMVQRAARVNGYSIKAYHQTGALFTEFSTDNPAAGKNDSETPNGIFFKTNDHDIGLGGGIQMEVYLNINNMLHFKNREEAREWYIRNVPGYAELHQEYDAAEQSFSEKASDLEKQWFEANSNDDDVRLEEIEKQEDELIESFKPIEDEYRGRLRILLNDYFLTGKSGYDGIELDYDGHRWVNGKREDVHTYIAFNPEQAKSADVITYDENGNVIPISQRFDIKKTDIRYQSRSDEAVSFRREMANYFEGLAQDDEERKLLAEYQAKVNELDADFKRMRKLREQIREMTFGKGPRDQEQLNALRKEAEKLARHVGAADRELLKLEAAEPMKLVMQRVEKNAVNRTNKKRKQDLEDYRERTAAKEVKGKIRRRLQELNKLMRSEDKKTVKEDMRGLVETAIELADRLFTDNITDEDIILGQIDQEDIRESDRAHLEKARQLLQELDKLGYDPKVMDQREKLKRQLSTEKGKIRELLLQQRNRLNAKEIDPVLNDLEKLYKRTLDSAIPGVKAQYDEAIIRDIQMMREEWQSVQPL